MLLGFSRMHLGHCVAARRTVQCRHMHLLLLPFFAHVLLVYVITCRHKVRPSCVALFFLASGMGQKPAAHFMLQVDLVVNNAM